MSKRLRVILAVFDLGKSMNRGKMTFCSSISSSIRPFSFKILARRYVASSFCLITSSVVSSAFTPNLIISSKPFIA